MCGRLQSGRVGPRECRVHPDNRPRGSCTARPDPPHGRRYRSWCGARWDRGSRAETGWTHGPRRPAASQRQNTSTARRHFCVGQAHASCITLLTYSALSVKDASVVQMKVAGIVEQNWCGDTFAERIAETIGTCEVVEDNRAANDGSLLDDCQRRLGRAVVVSVHEGKNEIFPLNQRACFGNVTGHYLDIAVVKITTYC